MKQVIALALLAVFITGLSLAESHERHHHSRTFTLTFQHAAREGVSLESNSFAVDFNGERVIALTPVDYELKTFRKNLRGSRGKNTINFIGTGPSDGLGQGIDNIVVRKNSYWDSEDVIVNGGFE